MKDKFIKNGVFSLEYDKETLRDMVLELQEENQELKIQVSSKEEVANKYKEVIDKAIKRLEKDYKFANYDIPLLTKDEQLAGKLLEILKEVE